MVARASKRWEIVTRRGRGEPLLWFDGRKFTNNGDTHKPMTFLEASKKAHQLLRQYEVLRRGGYHLWLRVCRRSNPESPGIESAARKLEDFSGHPASEVIETKVPTVKEGLVIGELDLIGYRTKREGIENGRTVSYAHRFRKKSRPLLAVSQDGNQLLIVGGRYEFTEAGIEDR